MTDSFLNEAILIKKRFWDDFIRASMPILYHIALVGFSAALALSLPMAVRFLAKQLLFYWSRVGNDKIFFLSVEIILTVCFILLAATIRKSWKDRKLSNMARAAGMVFVAPAKGFFLKRRIKKLKESQGIARDVMVISSTGFRTFADPKGELHQVIQHCRKAKVMLLNPTSAGVIARAKGIPDPGVTPETFVEQIKKSIDFLKRLKGAQKNVRLKLYPDPPFLKMTILGDFIWLQHYQPGWDVQRMPRYVFKHDPNIGSLYFPFYQYFLGRWNNPHIPEYDLETDELVYRDIAGNEVRREKMNEPETEGKTNTDPTNRMTLRNIRGEEEAESFSSLWPLECRVFPGDFSSAGRQNFQSGLHPGGKEFSLLRSKNPICETAGWIAIL
jgi:hypothetical protein